MTKSKVVNPPILVVLATAGIAAPILFTSLVVLQGLLWAEYSHIRHPISGLALGPNGWVQNVNVIANGFLFAVFAVGLHLGIAQNGRASLGPGLLIMSGLGLIGAGVFPATDVMGNGPIHGVIFVMVMVATGLGLIVTSRRLARNPLWQRLATYTLTSGVGVLVLFFVVSGLAFSDSAPLHPWLGVVQRLLVAVWFACTAVLAVRLLRLARLGLGMTGHQGPITTITEQQHASSTE